MTITIESGITKAFELSDFSNPAPNAHPVLRVAGVTRSFDGLRAVDEVGFEIGPGEVVALIGPNGSGKTSMLNLISGVLKPDSGTITLESADGAEVDVAGLDPERLAALGLTRTFQNGRVFASLSVAQNVAIGLEPKLRALRPAVALAGIPGLRWIAILAETAQALLPTPAARRESQVVDEAVTTQIARFGDRLTPRRDHHAFSLSYANRRRTEIARALIPAPRLLLLDEPTAGMNQTETAQVLEQLIAIKQTGQAMLIVEHKIDFVVALADRVLVLDGGRIIAEGTPAEVRDDPVVVEAYLGRPRERLSIIDPASVKNDSESTLLNLDSLRVDYGPVRALDDISLSVGKGEIVSLLGGNASGKSTTMKTILGLLKPSAGRITWDGTDITGASTAQRVRGGIASVPEARRIFPDMTVEENLLVGAYTRKNRREIAEDLDWIYELFPRLAERRRQHAGTFSGGEQQMLAFGRALISRPRLICMDEPTMGLSPRLVDQVLAQIAELNARSGVAVLIVEQQAELALSIAARGYVLASGRLVASGSAADLLADSKIQEAYLGRG